MDTIDEVVAEYADIAKTIYEKRLAGDHTWSGFLTRFLADIRATGEEI